MTVPALQHQHRWEPAFDLGMARYRCACGVVAWKTLRGNMVPYRHPPTDRVFTAEVVHCTGGRKPSLEEYDRG